MAARVPSFDTVKQTDSHSKNKLQSASNLILNEDEWECELTKST